MDPRNDVMVSKRSALNANAPEFIPAFRSANAKANSSGVQNSVSAKDSSVDYTATNVSSSPSSFNDQNKHYWESLLPDDITPEFDNLEDDLMGVQSLEEENSIELPAKCFPNLSEESVRSMYEACGCDLDFTMESLGELELQYQKKNDSYTHWESNMNFECGHTLDYSTGIHRSIVSPNFALHGVRANGNQLQTSSIPQRIPQQTSQVAINAGESLGTAGVSSNLGEPSVDISARNAYFDQASKTNLPAVKGQWHDAEGRYSLCNEELVHTLRNIAMSQLQNANSEHGNKIKLQVCDVKEAIRILRPVIAERRRMSCKTGQQQLLFIDMGSCLPIYESSAEAGLLLGVQQYLEEEEKLPCSQENSGELKVLISSQI